MPVEPRELTWNESMIADFRAHEGQITVGPMAGHQILLLTSIGAKSAEPKTAPLGYTRDGARYVVVGSNSGRDEGPLWERNVRENPRVTVEVGTETFPATATIETGAERRRLLDAHITAIPIFARYETMTDRPLPVVSLVRTA